MGGYNFTPEEDQYLRDHYPDEDTKEVSKAMGRSITAIHARSNRLKINKSEEAKWKYGCYLTGKEGHAYRYPKGHVPANKGKKMSAEQYEKSKHTFFKKGQMPASILPVGSITIRHNYKRNTKYMWIKLAEPKKWEMLHRYNWRMTHGPIPEELNLVFKDGNTLNCELDNLELITQVELMSRNTIQNYPKELKTTIHALGVLKRHINGKGRRKEKGNDS